MSVLEESREVAVSGTVFVVDDDREVRESLVQLFGSVGLDVEAFSAASKFLSEFDPSRSGCVVCDVRMPGMDGLALQQRLVESDITIPIVFITGFAEIRVTVQAMKAGAVEFLEKPYSPQELLGVVRSAISLDVDRRKVAEEGARRKDQLGSLTPREHEVMDLLLEGLDAKQVAFRLGLSSKTIDFHRRNLLQKMGVVNLVELARVVRPE